MHELWLAHQLMSGFLCTQHLVSLVGMSAPPAVLQKLTYIAFQVISHG